MSSPLTVKRRRLNESTDTLSRPFVSPLRTVKSDKPPLKPNDTAANQLPYQPSVHAHTIKATPPQHIKAVASFKSAQTPARSSPLRKQPPRTSSTKRTNPAELTAQKALTSLELQIRAIRNELDTLNQAAKLSSSTTDADLSDLTQKWKLASRTAAEELFGTVKERVCRMGGVAAWRESEKKKYERSNGLGEFKEEEAESDDADCEFDEEGEELPEEEQEYRKSEKRRIKQEMADAADVGDSVVDEGQGTKVKPWEEGGADDDTFTMDMMLRSLNIELNVIGYDKVAQRWVT